MNNTGSKATSFVVSLGLALLKDKRRYWVDMDAAAKCCRDHGIKLDSQYLGATDLERMLKEFFHQKDEFYAPGLNLDGYTRRVGWDDVFCLKAYPHALVQHPAPANEPKADVMDGTPPLLKGETPAALADIQMN